jgi:hypothetical protein
MSDFSIFGRAVNNAFNTIIQKDGGSKNHVFIVEATGDQLWEHYLASFPEGSNPMFRERTEHDCSTCRNFVKNIGAVVYAKGDEILSVWDVDAGDEVYQTVADAMSSFVKSLPIVSHFIVGEPSYGSAKTNHKNESWDHFYAKVPAVFMWKNNASDYIGERSNDVNGLRRSILEITDEAIEIVGDLISQDSLFKGKENKWAIDLLLKYKREYNALETEHEKSVFLWTHAKPQTRIRGTMFGTLLVDLSEDEDLEVAVKKYEDKASGTNHQRPKALVTQKMIDSAKKLVVEMDLEDSLARRYAVREDISVNDVLFVDGSIKKSLLGGAFDTIKPTKKSVPELTNVEEISIKDFLKNVLPKAEQIEMFVKNSHKPNFVSLIAPVHPDAKPLFKWDNGFSWSYTGEVADSIRERVKKAGGKIDGAVRVSLSWHNGDDLDLSVVKDKRDRLYFGNPRMFNAHLDVDMNAGAATNSVNPVENIVWAKERDVMPGRYEIVVHNWCKRSTASVGFEVEVEVLGKVYSFVQPQDLRDKAQEVIGVINVSRDGEINVEGMKGGDISVEQWGIKTEDWTPVDLVTLSPNFWNDKQVGHQHVLFMLKGCVNPEGTRGFYNEFLRTELKPHRKVFEVVSAQLKVPYNDHQLSGIGFSDEKRDEVLLRVKGSINRILNVKF